MKQLLAGNWKMHGTQQDARRLIADIINGLDAEQDLLEVFDFAVFPPFLHMTTVRHALYGFPKIFFGAQDCAAQDDGPLTGDVSARMLQDAACQYVILGHSERRRHHGESDETVNAKVVQAFSRDLLPIVCVGETEAEREKGQQFDVCARQLLRSLPRLESFHHPIIAYEPVWAIGTGKTAAVQDIETMHNFIIGWFGENYPGRDPAPVLYGGSVKPENARQILSLPQVGGALIGGASLKAETFLGIARSAL